MPSAEEKLEKILEKHEKRVEDRLISVWLWGFACGAVLSTSNLLSVTIGSVLGYVISKGNLTPFKNLFNTFSKKI
jgi:hypothetical protein